MSLSSVAEKEGLGFVASLWTEQGIQNPNAIFRNTLIGMLWATLCIIVARLLPPARTARCFHSTSTKLIPKLPMASYGWPKTA